MERKVTKEEVEEIEQRRQELLAEECAERAAALAEIPPIIRPFIRDDMAPDEIRELAETLKSFPCPEFAEVDGEEPIVEQQRKRIVYLERQGVALLDKVRFLEQEAARTVQKQSGELIARGLLDVQQAGGWCNEQFRSINAGLSAIEAKHQPPEAGS